MARAAFQHLNYSDLPSWSVDDHAAAFSCFLLSAEKSMLVPPSTKEIGVDGEALSVVMQIAREQAGHIKSNGLEREFFETHFCPVDFAQADDTQGQWPGLLTGYYEPVIEGSRVKTPDFSIPLLTRPSDLVEIKSIADKSSIPPDWPKDLRFGRKSAGGLTPYFDRAQIEGRYFNGGALAGQGLELVWLKDIVEAFFIHIQGSACIRLPRDDAMRVSYDGKSGHDYTAIGKVLKDRGLLSAGTITMQSIKAWLRENPEEQLNILHQNRSFIFFQEEHRLKANLGPRAAAGVQLTSGRSLAVDRTLHTFHTPIYVSFQQANKQDHRLMVAQDTGSAIVGPHRGDFFAGSGEVAGEVAGGFAASACFILLVPRAQLERPL